MTVGTRGRTLPLFVVLVCAAAGASCRRPAPPAPDAVPRRPNVLLITIDTLRADRLGRGFTPTLDRLAAAGARFTSARTAVPLTFPSHATILSGLLPPHHGVRLNGAGHFADHPTLATILRANGYRTAAAVGAFVLARQFGLAEGFDGYDDAIPRDPEASTVLEAERRATAVTDAALVVSRNSVAAPKPHRGERGPADQPLFLWVHYYDPHAPYTPPPEFLAKANGSAYDGEIAYVDDEVGRLLDGLAGGGLDRDLLIVVAGDHGESLGEHGESTHGMLLYDGALRVPLFFSARAESRGGSGMSAASGAPGRGSLLGHAAAAAHGENVSLADVAPTILALLGIRPPQPMDGLDILGSVAPDRELFAETRYPALAGWSPLAALVSGPWKLIGGGRTQLFDVARDRAEARDLSADRSPVASAMRARLRAVSAGGKDTTAPLSSEARERLRSLGYVAPSSDTPPPADAPDPADRIADWRAFEEASMSGAGLRARELQRLRDLSVRNPSAQVFFTAWARALGLAGRHDEALRAYREAVKRWPGDAVLMHDLAVAARDAKQPDEALRAEEAALTLDPRFPAALNGLGLLHADAGRAADAAAAFERAAALDRTDPSFAANLGNARRATGQLEAAREAYLAALALDPGWADAANGIGVLEVQAGRPADAIAWFEKALARSPDLVEARLNLGIAYQEAGQVSRAKATYQAVLKAPARFARERDAARQLLQGMGR